MIAAWRLARRTAGWLKPHWRLFSALLLVVVAQALMSGIAEPLITQTMIDSLGSQDTSAFLWLAGFAIVIATFTRLASLAGDIGGQTLNNKLWHGFALKSTRAFYRTPHRDVAKEQDGYHVSRLYDEPKRLTTVVDLSLDAVVASVTCLGALMVCLWFSWKVMLVLSVIVPSLLYLAERFGGQIRDVTTEGHESEARLRASFGRAVSSHRNVQIFELRPPVLGRLQEMLNKHLDIVLTTTRISSRYQTASGVLLAYAEVAVLIGVGIQVLYGQLSIGGLFGFTQAYWRVVQGARSLAVLVPKIAELSAIAERFEDLVKEQPDTTNLTVDGALALKAVQFSHNDRSLLRKIDISIDQGDRVLITGANGTGKSTLLHLMLGMLEPQDGVAETPKIKDVSAMLLPFAFVPGNLGDQLDLDKRSPDAVAQIKQLAQKLGIDNRWQEDPANFSEGEKKKAQVLMTLSKDADFYVFDEPLANIDSDTKSLVLDTILSLGQDKAIIVVLHGDHGLYEHFDRELQLRDGTVFELQQGLLGQELLETEPVNEDLQHDSLPAFAV